MLDALERRHPVPDHAARNRGPILDVLRKILPAAGTVLEIGSGSGSHTAFFAHEMPKLTFQPSERSGEALARIEARIRDAGLANIEAALRLDIFDEPWPLAHADAVIAINVLHIAPWEAAPVLIEKAAAILPQGAPLYFYGPFHRSTVTRPRAISPSMRACVRRIARWGCAISTILRPMPMLRASPAHWRSKCPPTI